MTEFSPQTTDRGPAATPFTPQQADQDTVAASPLEHTLAESHAILGAFTQLQARFADSALDSLERQVVYLTAAHSNNCHYCTLEYPRSEDPRGAEMAAAINENRAIGDRRLQTLRRFTKAVTERRGWVPEELAAQLMDAGFSRAQMLDVVMGVTLVNLGSYVTHITATPVDAAGAMAS
ncbi:MAG: hypothetical protein U5S82_02265 [Gammaproteobacteria bacterium]|nr:hypothetical protein [Gammaproteobacteria bacterium]